MSPPDDAPDSVRNAYYDWIDRRLLQDVRDSEPEVFGWIVDRARELIVYATETTVQPVWGGVMSRQEYIRASVAASRQPGLCLLQIRDAVISDVKFTETLGLKADAVIRFGRDDLTFQRSALFKSHQAGLRSGRMHRSPSTIHTGRDLGAPRTGGQIASSRLPLSGGRHGSWSVALACYAPTKVYASPRSSPRRTMFALHPQQIAPWKELLEGARAHRR